MVSCELVRSAVKGHDTANYERVQFQWILTSELVGLSHFGILLTVAMWPYVILLVGWPWVWWIVTSGVLRHSQVLLDYSGDC